MHVGYWLANLNHVMYEYLGENERISIKPGHGNLMESHPLSSKCFLQGVFHKSSATNLWIHSKLFDAILFAAQNNIYCFELPPPTQDAIITTRMVTFLGSGIPIVPT